CSSVACPQRATPLESRSGCASSRSPPVWVVGSMISAPVLARRFFATSAPSPPTEVAPATIRAAVAMHAGHMGSGSGPRQVFGEAVQAAGPAALMRIARGDRLEDGLVQGELRLRAVLGEAHRQHRFVAGLALRVLPGPGEHEPLGLHDFAIDTPQPVVGALRRAHAEADGASRAD